MRRNRSSSSGSVHVVCAARRGAIRHSGWSFEIDRGEDGNQFKVDETLEADALLLGRRTYESFAGAWPEREGEFADKFNSMPKYVVSTTLNDPQWNNHRPRQR